MSAALHLTEVEPSVEVPTDRSPVLPPPAKPRDLVFVDLETTGLDPERHDIVEIGVVRVDGRTLEVLAELELRVVPERVENADPEALAVSGFDPGSWSDAVPLAVALGQLAPLLSGALVAGHNVGFDWSFLVAAHRRVGLPLPEVDYHRLDTASLAWTLASNGEIRSMSLDPVAEHLGLERPTPHRALADAHCSLNVARRLRERMKAGGRLASLEGDEQQIAETLLARLGAGRRQYGPWNVGDGRDYPAEAYEEVLDGLHYVAAELVRRRREQRDRRRRIYVCHPFGGDPSGNADIIRRLCRGIVDDEQVPVAPQLYLPEFIDEELERERALDLCLELVRSCDELRVFGSRITGGMQRELAFARALRLPITFEEVLS